ncbi:DUF2789 domain-containing protein [Gayadomonas joobiniege]|uniref:DUF2789 domain-containing protein n=1 Tax=Gayadomonas joobiniege TaxID=1234606 RepID=UPI0003700C4E|nr:DUF2789 domain-containing protein [Gayadomonas joobiniege]
METEYHSLEQLFEQLGLDNSDAAIDAFIARHRPLDESTAIYDADFWSRGQAAFLKEALEDDSNWAEVVDQLDAQLR